MRFSALFFLLAPFTNLFGSGSDDMPPPQLADLSGEPSAFINNCVNVITGDYCEMDQDLSVPGHLPLTLDRCYVSSSGKEGTLKNGWNFNHTGRVHIVCSNVNHSGKERFYANYTGECGSFILLDRREHSVDQWKYPLRLSPYYKIYSSTNTSQGSISGRSNLKNTTLNYEEKNEFCQVNNPDGSTRHFKNHHHNNSIFNIWKHVMPEGSYYDYLWSKRDDRFKEMTAKGRSGATFSSIKFQYDENNKWVQATTSDNKTVRYEFLKRTVDEWGAKAYYLEKVTRSNAPPVKYGYWKKGHQINRKELPEGRFLNTEYYSYTTNYVGGKKVKIESKSDPRYHRVMQQKAPVGFDDTPITTHRFFYTVGKVKPEKKKKEQVIATEVRDAYDRKTIFRITDEMRLSAIEKYDGNEQLYSVERLEWGKRDTKNAINLLSRTFEDKNGNILFRKQYTYDDRGNLLEETLEGDLTGKGGYEVFTKKASYDEKNRITYENDGITETLYVYHPERDLLTGKFLLEGGNIRKREFYMYDQNSVMIKKIVDNGRTVACDHLEHVTERRFTAILPTASYPVGLPQVVDEGYYDIYTGTEKLLKRTVNQYGNWGRLRVQKIYDANNTYCYTLDKEYDAYGNVVRETDPLGQVTVRKFDANGNMTYEKGPRLDMHKEYTYDFSNRLIKEEEVHPGVRLATTHRYDYIGNRIATSDCYGNETCFSYDPFNRKTETSSPPSSDGSIIRAKTRYNEMSFPVIQEDGNGNATQTKFTIRGAPAVITYPDGTQETFEYDLAGKLMKQTDKKGVATCFSYDYQGRITEKAYYGVQGEFLYRETYTYNALQLLTETDGNGAATYYSYNSAGQLTAKRKESSCTNYFYDSLGRLWKTAEYFEEDDWVMRIEEKDYLGRVIEERVEDKQGTVLKELRYRYDAGNNRTHVIAVVDGKASVEETLYNSLNLPIKRIDPEGNVTRSSYRYDYFNSSGQCIPYIETVDPCGNVEARIYDTRQRLVETHRKNNMGQLIQKNKIVYDDNGNRIRAIETAIVDGKPAYDCTYAWQYDEMNKLILSYEAWGTPLQTCTEHRYNRKGLLKEIHNPAGTVLFHSYDSLGRLSELRASDATLHYQYEYDLNGNLIRSCDPLHDTATERAYDLNNRLVEEKFGNGLLVQYDYDMLGRPVQTLLPDGSGVRYCYDALGLREVERNGLYIDYDEYDAVGNPIRMATPAGEIRYHYDRMSRITSIESPAWREDEMKYDALGNLLHTRIEDARGEHVGDYGYNELSQLTQESGKTEQSYSYDSLYNRRSKNGARYEVDMLNQLKSDGKNRYSYDPNGNCTEKSGPEGTCHYSYDALNRLISIRHGESRTEYLYDSQNRRLSKTLYLSGQKVSAVLFLYHGENEVGACSEAGEIEELRILGIGKGAEIGASVLMELKGKSYIPVHDHNGNVSCLMDTEGAAVESYRYTAFGEEEQAPSELNPWRFSGKRKDAESGLIYYGRRYYQPEAGRWLTRDPLGYAAGPNFYAFVRNNPLTHIDLYGLLEEKNSRFGFLGTAMRYHGQVLKALGDHALPLPGIRDCFSRAGRYLCGENVKDTPLDYKERSKNFDLGLPEFSSKVRFAGANGILNNRKEAYEQASMLSHFLEGYNVNFSHNSTHGAFSDLIECTMQKAGIYTHSVQMLEKNIRQRIKEVGGPGNGGMIFLFPHSQGGLTVYNVIQRLSPEERKMLHVISFGSAKMIPKEGLGSCINYVSENDGVPFVSDYDGVQKGRKEGYVEMLRSSTGPLIDHPIAGDTYRAKLQSRCKEIITELKGR